MNNENEKLPEPVADAAPDDKRENRRAFTTGLAAIAGAAALFAGKAQAASQDPASRELKSKILSQVKGSIVEPVEAGGDTGLYSKTGGSYSK